MYRKRKCFHTVISYLFKGISHYFINGTSPNLIYELPITQTSPSAHTHREDALCTIETQQKVKNPPCPECGKRENRQPLVKFRKTFYQEKLAVRI